MTELTLSIRSQFSLQLNCYEMLWLYIDKGRLQGIPQNFYSNYPKNSLSWNSVYPYSRMVSYGLVPFMLKLKPRPEEQTPCHSSFSGGIICGPYRGSFAVQFGDHFRPGDHLRSRIICILGDSGVWGAVCKKIIYNKFVTFFAY